MLSLVIQLTAEIESKLIVCSRGLKLLYRLPSRNPSDFLRPTTSAHTSVTVREGFSCFLGSLLVRSSHQRLQPTARLARCRALRQFRMHQ
jgi:hypothetical protein